MRSLACAKIVKTSSLIKENDMIDDIIPFDKSREENWRKGFHIDQNGRHHFLSDMDDEHLFNAIRLYKDRYDVKPLEVEVFIRGL